MGRKANEVPAAHLNRWRTGINRVSVI